MTETDLKRLSTAELDALIRAATAERAKRDPAVPMEHPTTFEAIIDPRWAITLAHPNTIVQLRHPGHGWVAFVLPPNERAQILGLLLQHSLYMASPQQQAPAPAPTPMAGGGTVH